MANTDKDDESQRVSLPLTEEAPKEQKKEEKIKIAACPTFYDMIKKLDAKKYQLIYTDSTAQSVKLLENKRTDFVLAGRTLKPNEPDLEYVVIDEGYSFLSSKSKTVNARELKDYIIYTDLETEQLKRDLMAGKIEKTDSVYKYLDKGIVVTSWENTDYNRAEIVHVLKDNGERLAISRRPTLYCSLSCDKEELTNLISVLK